MSTGASIGTATVFFGIAAIAWIAAALDKHRERKIEAEEYEESGEWSWPTRCVGPAGRERVDDRFRRRAA